MKRPRCRSCKHTMKGHKKRRCEKEKTIKYEGGAQYNGSIYNNLPSGYGVFDSEDTTYRGQWLAGKRHGEGTENWTNGRSYTGVWRSGLFHGQGVLVVECGTVYEGNFHTGTYHGQGKLTAATGSYSGQWNHGTYHGIGTQITTEGVFKGQFYYNIRHGEGTFTDVHGNIYSGKWRKGMREGRGVYTTDDGTYSGDWSHNLQSGNGRWVSKRHGIYIGQWKRGKRHRKGIQTYTDGTTYDGGWSKGERTGFGLLTWPDGSTYEGFWLKDQYNGRGTLTRDNNSFFGEWNMGMREGIFLETLPDGSTSKGPWVNDLRHGTFEKDDGRFLYIWNTPVKFQSPKKAKKSVINMLQQHDYEGARVVLEFYPTLITCKLFVKFDVRGDLLYMLPQDDVFKILKRQSFHLFKAKRFLFLEEMMKLCPESKQYSIMDKVPELFDTLSKDFVPNPWIVRGQSYSESTKQKLLEGIHLGEFGRCPPKDPYTRLPMNKNSGRYLETQTKKAKKIYSRFMKCIDIEPEIREIARSFDIQDFEKTLQNARETNDRETIKRIMKERNIYLST